MSSIVSIGLLALGAPAVTVCVDPNCVGMGEVGWSERVVGDGTTRLTLMANAAAGNAFSGWEISGAGEVAWPADIRYPGSLTVTVSTAAVVTASFIPSADDRLEFDFDNLLAGEIECNEATEVPVEVDSASFPALTFSGLPPGITYRQSTLTLAGTPRTPGVYHVAATGENASGFTFQDFFTVKVGNVSGSRVTGEDVEIPLGEYYVAEFAESEFGGDTIFSCSEGWKRVALSGLPPGLTWNGASDWEVVSGTPTKTGDWTVTATVTFSNNTSEVATMLMSVVAPDPDEYDVDLGVLDDLRVGDEFAYQDDVVGEYNVSSGLGVTAITGLPKGLSAKKWIEKGVRYWGIDGRAEKPGRYEVSVKVAEADEADGKRTVDTRRIVTVRDVADVYLSAMSADSSMGTVTGGGAVSPVEDVVVTASAKSGYVFSGWHDADGEAIQFEDGVDYRSPTVTFAAGTDFSFLSLVAHFIARDDDVEPEFGGLDGEEYSFAADDAFAEVFEINSASLPVLTFKGLPRGVSCESSGSGSFVLAYDGSSTSSKPTPGRYAVAATATNRSGRKATASFMIVVANIADSRIRVEDDYGEYDPGGEIDAIDLSDAVDFDKGEKLAVSGLPNGLKYNAKAKGEIAANTITGTPTVPGHYTLTFTAKVVSSVTTNASGKVSYKYETAKATSFLTVLPYPELSIEVDDDALDAGNKVSGGGNYKAGTKVTLKATAAKGWVFAGWEGLDDVGTLEALNPKLAYVTTGYDVFVSAKFIEVRDDWLYLCEPSVTDNGYAAELAYDEDIAGSEAEGLIADLIETGSYPTVKVSDLPKGLKFSASTFLLSGKPTKSGVFHVTVTVKNAGGYSFVRVLDIAVLKKNGSLPEEEELPNEAEIDFGPLTGLTTGLHCPTGSVVLSVGGSVKKVSVSGLPTGLAAAVMLDESGATVEVTGTPTKPGRQIVTLKVTYDNGKSATSKCAVVVQDGGSCYLDVQSLSEDGGTVSGSGVYASGAKVKIAAKAKSKHVFAGWFVDDEPFAALQEIDGIDYRTDSVTFPFRPNTIADNALYGKFVLSEDDGAIAFSFEDETWEIDPDESSQFPFAVESSSLPKLTVKGLPKGVTVDLARGMFFYEPTASAVPGIYTTILSAKNSTVKAAVTDSFEIRIANRESAVIHGLDPDMNAYVVPMGTTLDPDLVTPEADDGWSLSAKGLPTGLSYKNGVVSGVPTKAGDYTVTFTATTGKGSSKRTEVATITMRVQALPMTATGTFNGFLINENDAVVGTVKLSATAAGKVSASVAMPDKKLSFSAKAWDSLVDGVAEVAVTDKNENSISVAVNSTMDWKKWQLSGECRIGDAKYTVSGQRNPYGKNDGVEEAKEAIAAMVGTSSLDGWSAKISKDGAVTVSGKYDGKSVSGSCTLLYDDGYFARYVKFIDKKVALNVILRFNEEGKMTECETEAN